ncbi:hypothetical protein [Pantoea sp. ANP04]|uniref:hypothetical protein n=1 Tax=Pantoea sp. ANP04 TaxID=3064896 RepID=UPI0035C56BBB
MIKILIVDDSIPRINKFKNALTDLLDKNAIEVDEAFTSDSAKIALRLKQYDYLILDVFLPKKEKYTPDEKNGLELLKYINSDKYSYSPKKIVGITAHLKDIIKYEAEFRHYASIIFEARINDISWVESLKKIIHKDVESDAAVYLRKEDNILITVHGIRTLAPWQKDIETKLKSLTNNFKFTHFNYGFLNVVCFMLPPTRYLFSKKIINDLELVVKNNSKRRIFIISHSFGTYLTYHALRRFYGSDVKIECVIFSGSVLRRDVSMEPLKKITRRIVNDCAVEDYILLACNSLVLGLGDAGRKGFKEPNDECFTNRYFKGGHSVYFEKDDFIEQYWMPLLTAEGDVANVDSRKSHIFSDVTNAVQNLLSYVKGGIWFFIFSLVAFYIFS